MTSVRLLMVLAGLAVTLAQPAAADGPSESILRAESHAIGTAIDTQAQARLHAAGRPVSASATQIQPGPQVVTAPQGAPLHANPAPDSPVLDRLAAGAPVIVTGPVGANGWAEVVSGGQHGYVWAPHLSPQELPAPAWQPAR